MDDLAEYEGEAQPPPAQDPLLAYQQIVAMPNIAVVLPEDKLSEIGHKVVTEYEIDKQSRSDWERRTKKALDLAMRVSEPKDYPFKDAANVKFPLLTTAALQFNARAYPAIVQGNRVVKCTTWGKDPQGIKAARGERVSEHMSYQLLSELPEWEQDTDSLLIMLPIVGCVFRKVYYDPALGRNCTRLIPPDRLVVNYFARSMEDVPRTTEKMFLYPNEIQERIRTGRFVTFDYGNVGQSSEEAEGQQQDTSQDTEAPHLFLEQHRLLDLDGDGYSEPYIVTVHHATRKVCRVVANFNTSDIRVVDGKVAAITKQNYYVRYLFLPSPDGGFYGWGFGWLLNDIGESINTTINQMIDAGHLTIVQGGLISANLGIKEKSIRLKMGEWRVINSNGPLNQAIMPISYPGPSEVLFKLLGLLVETGKEVAAVKDVLTGDTPATAPVGTTLAIIEQGLQVFTSIYKRIHRALKAELGLHARLNRMFLSPEKYKAFCDEPADPQQDYAEADMDIVPVSDPNSVSKMQTIAKATLLGEMLEKDQASPTPMMDAREVRLRMLEAAQIEDTDKLFMPPPQPDPEEEFLKRLVAKLNLDAIEAKNLKDRTAALKNIADAEAAEAGTQLQAYATYLSALAERANGQGSVSGVEGQPGDQMGAGAPSGAGNGGGGPVQLPPVPLNGAAPGGMGSATGASGF